MNCTVILVESDRNTAERTSLQLLEGDLELAAECGSCLARDRSTRVVVVRCAFSFLAVQMMEFSHADASEIAWWEGMMEWAS